MGSKPTSIDPTEEVEEPGQVSEDHDTGGIQAGRSQKDVGQDGPLAIGGAKGSSLYLESWMVQTSRADISE